MGEHSPTKLTLQMADQSVTRAYGTVEDVLVQVGDLVLAADFVILDIEVGEVSFILGRSFMATGETIIDVSRGKLTM